MAGGRVVKAEGTDLAADIVIMKELSEMNEALIAQLASVNRKWREVLSHYEVVPAALAPPKNTWRM